VTARDGAPVSGAGVRVALVDGEPAIAGTTSWTATTSPDGSFQTPELPDGTFDVSIAHPQFAPARVRSRVPV
jgi:hypothetical protein